MWSFVKNVMHAEKVRNINHLKGKLRQLQGESHRTFCTLHVQEMNTSATSAVQRRERTSKCTSKTFWVVQHGKKVLNVFFVIKNETPPFFYGYSILCVYGCCGVSWELAMKQQRPWTTVSVVVSDYCTFKNKIPFTIAHVHTHSFW
jgi:hypothetical protein